MRTSVVKTILDDSISGNKIHGGAVSGLASLESALVYISGGSGSFIRSTEIGSSASSSDRKNIYGQGIAAYSALSFFASDNVSELFSTVNMGTKDPMSTWRNNGAVFFQIRKAATTINPTALRLMTETAPSAPFVARCGGQWYFDSGISVDTVTARTYITIPDGNISSGGGISISTLVSQHKAINSWWSSFEEGARNKIATLTLNGAQSCVNLGLIGSAISQSTWNHVKGIDQPLSTNDDVEFNSVSTTTFLTNRVQIDDTGIVLDRIDFSTDKFSVGRISAPVIPVATADSNNMVAAGSTAFTINYKQWGTMGQILIPEFTITPTITGKTQLVYNCANIQVSYDDDILGTSNKILIATHVGQMNSLRAFGKIFARESSTNTLELIFEFFQEEAGFYGAHPYNPATYVLGFVGVNDPIYAPLPLALIYH